MLCETSISGMANFNQSFQPRLGVYYHVIHAASPRHSQSNTLGSMFRAAIPGFDDMTIQTTRNLTTFVDTFGPSHGRFERLRTHDPHSPLVSTVSNGQNFYYLATNGSFDSAYQVCIHPMFIERSISEWYCGTPVTESNLAAADATAEGETRVAANLAAEDETTEQNTPLQSSIITDTLTVYTDTLNVVETGRPVTLASSWTTGTVALQLFDPNGNPISSGEIYTDELRYIHTFTPTLTGGYVVRLQAAEVPTTGLTAQHFFAPDSDYKLVATRSRNWLGPDETITLAATFTGPTAIQNPEVKAYLLARLENGSQLTETLTLTPDTSGQFSTVYTAPNAPGYVDVTVIARGVVGGLEIAREANFSFTVYPNTFKLADHYEQQVIPQGLVIHTDISVTNGVTGTVRVTGILADDQDAEVSRATTIVNVEEITSTVSVPLFFDGQDLLASGNGAFKLLRVLVVDERYHALVSDDKSNVFTTTTIDVDPFAHTLFLPLIVH